MITIFSYWRQFFWEHNKVIFVAKLEFYKVKLFSSFIYMYIRFFERWFCMLYFVCVWFICYLFPCFLCSGSGRTVWTRIEPLELFLENQFWRNHFREQILMNQFKGTNFKFLSLIASVETWTFNNFLNNPFNWFRNPSFSWELYFVVFFCFQENYFRTLMVKKLDWDFNSLVYFTRF